MSVAVIPADDLSRVFIDRSATAVLAPFSMSENHIQQAYVGSSYE